MAAAVCTAVELSENSSQNLFSDQVCLIVDGGAAFILKERRSFARWHGREAGSNTLLRTFASSAAFASSSPSAVRGHRDFALQFTTQGLGIALLGRVKSCVMRCPVRSTLY